MTVKTLNKISKSPKAGKRNLSTTSPPTVIKNCDRLKVEAEPDDMV